MTIECTGYNRPNRFDSTTRMAAMDIDYTLTFEPAGTGTPHALDVRPTAARRGAAGDGGDRPPPRTAQHRSSARRRPVSGRLLARPDRTHRLVYYGLRDRCAAAPRRRHVRRFRPIGSSPTPGSKPDQEKHDGAGRRAWQRGSLGLGEVFAVLVGLPAVTLVKRLQWPPSAHRRCATFCRGWLIRSGPNMRCRCCCAGP